MRGGGAGSARTSVGGGGSCARRPTPGGSASAQAIAEPFLRLAEGDRFDVLSLEGRYVFDLETDRGRVEGTISLGRDGAMTAPRTLDEYGAQLGAPVSGPLRVLPTILSGDRGFIPIVSPLGAFGIRARFESDDFTGSVSGLHTDRIQGPLQARRLAGAPAPDSVP